MAYWTLARLAKAQGVKLKPRVLPPIFIPPDYEKRLYRLYKRVCDLWWQEAKAHILPAYANAAAVAREVDKRRAEIQKDAAPVFLTDDLKEGKDAVNVAAQMAERVIVALQADLVSWATSVEKYQRGRFVGAVKSATNVDLSTILHPNDVRTTLEAVIDRNMSLIRNVSDETRQRIADIFFRNYQQRTPLRQVAKEISEAVGLSRARSLRIASDQTTKLAAALDEERMKEAGITKFQWVHSGKVHFRPEHKARDGKVYNWATARSVLKGDLPGVAINCGCKAKAVIDF